MADARAGSAPHEPLYRMAVLPLRKLLGRIGARLERHVAVGGQRAEPGGPLHRGRTVEHPVGAGVAVPVDQVAPEALQHRRVRVRPPLTGVAGLQVQRVLVLAAGLDRGQRGRELVLGPGLVDGRDADPVLLQGRRPGLHDQRHVVVADGVILTVEAADHAGQELGDPLVQAVQRGQVPGPGPVRHVRAVHVQDAGQALGGGRRRHRGVVGVLRERLDLDLVVALAGVVVRDDLVDRGEFRVVARVVRPHLQRGRAAGVGLRVAAAARSLAAGGQGERQRHSYTRCCEALAGR